MYFFPQDVTALVLEETIDTTKFLTNLFNTWPLILINLLRLLKLSDNVHKLLFGQFVRFNLNTKLNRFHKELLIKIHIIN